MRASTELLNDVLEDVALYRVGTLDAFRTAAYFERTSRRVVRRTIDGYVQDGFLVAGPLLTTGETYYALGPRGSKHLKLPASHSGLLSVDPLISAFAVLRFCRLSEPQHDLLARQQLERFFPQIMGPGVAGPFYLDDQTGRLARIRFDRVRPRRWDRIVQRCERDLAKVNAKPDWAEFITGNRFQVTILTVLPQKVPRLETVLKQLSDTSGVLFRIQALPELFHLIRPPAESFPQPAAG